MHIRTPGRRIGALATLALLAALAACHAGPPTTTVAIDAFDDTGNGTRHFHATHQGRPDDQITWNFGDGTTATGTAADHAYARAGLYTVTATAPDGNVGTHVVDVDFGDRIQGHACVPGSSWCWQAEKALPGSARQAYFVDSQHGWVYSELGAGAIAATTDGGLTWTAQTVPSVHQLVAFRFSDALHGVVTSSANELMNTDDGGATWRLVTDALPSSALGGTGVPMSVTPGRIVLDAAQASTDGGHTWTALPLDAVTDVPGDTDCWNVGDTRVMRLAGCAGSVATDVTPPGWHPPSRPALRAFTSPQRVLLLLPGAPTAGWETQDAGASWQAFTPQGLQGLTPSGWLMTSATDGWLVAEEGGLFATHDAGRTWSPLVLPASFRNQPGVLTLGRVPDGTPWVSDGRSVARTSDGGLTWDVLVLPVPDTLLWNLTTWRPDGSEAAVVDGSQGWRFADGAWQRIFGSDPAGVVGGPVAFVARDARHALAVATNGVQWRTTDGVHWSPSSPFPAVWQFPVALEYGADASAWLAQGGRLWRSTDDGGAWQAAVTPGPLAAVSDVHVVDATHAWLLDQQTGLYRSSDAGGHWSRVTTPGVAPWALMAFVSADRGMLVGFNGATWLTADGGQTWQAADPRPDVRRLKVTADGVIWSFGYQFQRSQDGGATFTTVAPQLPPPMDVTFTDARNGWLVDQDGGASYTDDGGATWHTTALGDFTVQFQAVAMADTRTGWIITATGDLLFTAIGGR